MEDELVQNILSQSTYDSAWNRFLNKPDWKDKYRTGVSELLSQVKDTQNNNNSFFSSLSGNHVEIPSIESSMEKASQNWAVQDATKRAEERLAKEKEAATYPTFSTSYDVTRGWRDSTEDAARLDKYIVEELGASPEEAQQVYNDTWNNSNKTLGIATAATLGTAATFGAAGGVFGHLVADITNGLFAVDAARNLASGEGVQKTFKLARQGDWKGALKSGAWDALDLSMLGHTAGLVGRVGKSVLSGRSLGNAYRSDVAGRLLEKEIKTVRNPQLKQLRYAKKYDLTPTGSNMGISEYELYDSLTGKSIGKMGTTYDIRHNNLGVQRVDNIIGSEGNRGVSRSLYNAALDDRADGLISGEHLVHPEITERVWTHFPREVIADNGFRVTTGKHDGDVVRLTSSESFVPILDSNNTIYISKKMPYYLPQGKTYHELTERFSFTNPNGIRVNFKQGGILKAQKGRIIKSIGNAAKTKKVELTGDLFAGMGTPKSVFKPRSFKGYSINTGAFSGVENLTPYHWGYNKQIPMLIIKDYKIQSPKVNPISNLEKFLQKSAQERDNIVRYWNGENFNSFSQLESNPKQLKLFEDWLNKQ